ncbi:MAG: D,D-heptose 1,7-bisphosphate phosphatase [candidate division Zixibacteria bacterium RBG-1]|nr:MAG: D,D-heptose 1,7-bisphosphate phosphatase [candidate division Zixibacteria bacterium RBG-1]OGC85708.1 MAG: hypothetical protein A2V73_01350 [candidate division Zixibacteria bacterium RBG_19FT_COMBO_42_43]
MRQKAAFLDRDGTIIQENGYISRINQIEFIPGSVKAVQILKSLGYKIIVITNQSGVAQRFFTEKSLKKVHKYLQKQLRKDKAGWDGIYYCPHHPRVGLKRYLKDCNCRKPKTGLVKLAAREHKLKLKGSVVIGDRLSDVGLGKNAQIKSILLLTGHGKKESKKITAFSKSKPDFIAKNLLEAAKLLQNQVK